jgi:hypothetical protein
MKTCVLTILLLLLPVLPGGRLCALEPAGHGWDVYMPATFKVARAVALNRNPFQGHGRAQPVPGVPAGARNALSARLAEQLRKGVHGLVVSAEHPCLLLDARIVAIGQTVELPVEDQGGRRVLRLRLRSVTREQLGFLVDEAGARWLGSEEWTCNLKGEASP